MPVKRILFLGEICAEKGRQAIIKKLASLREIYKPSFIIANGENAAGGFGITPRLAEELFQAGINCITTGDHFLDRREAENFFNSESRLLRPANYPDGVCGRGYCLYEVDNYHIGVINLLGRVFLKLVDCPFQTVAKVIELVKPITNTIIVDFHAEATAEKVAMGWFLDGKVSAVLGTHTHIQTADEKILPNGTAYISDVGMCGPFASVIGMRTDLSLKRMLYSIPVRLQPAKEDVHICGVTVDLDTETGKATKIQRIDVPVTEEK
jgi:metallophosphoesterase (TIGR00282 family)|uniref:TIGR00282 family metallophosphoesterase n=1 Tax=candidate division WOR-3 bacterium TaxID=2052148 RepID=A0A7C6EBK8_UNCW3